MVRNTVAITNRRGREFPRAALTPVLAMALLGALEGGGAIPARAQAITSYAPLSGQKGYQPQSALVADDSGGFLGTAHYGGPTANIGTVYRYSPGTNTITTLAGFALVNYEPVNGSYPTAALVSDGTGNFLGTTTRGGASAVGSNPGYGTIFQFSPSTNAITTLFSFNGANGDWPAASLVSDGSGGFLGTTLGGSGGSGTLFQYTPSTNTFTTLVNFNGVNGASPYAALISDGTGSFLGTTYFGGANSGAGLGGGTLFKYTPSTNTLTTLFSFGGSGDGSQPIASLISDGAGGFLGTTVGGGAFGDGTLFRYDPSTNALTTLVSFNGANGAAPHASLISDGNGNFLGTTEQGGSVNKGTIFEYSPSTNALTTLVHFDGVNGQSPDAALVSAGGGKFLGTSPFGGGSLQPGTVFMLDLNAPPAPIPTPTPPPAHIAPEPGTAPLVGATLLSVSTLTLLAHRKPRLTSARRL